MRLALTASVVLAGFVIGWIQRTLIVTLAVPPGQPPRRACPACGYQIRLDRLLSRAALPLSGRCPSCQARAGPPLLATELTTSLVLGVLAARLPPGPELVAAAWLAICGTTLAWIDAAVHRLPDVLTAPAYAGTAAVLLFAALISGHWHNLARAMFGGLLLGAFYLLLVLISPSGMGGGDVKLSASIGTLLAWSGWMTLVDGTFATFALGGLYGIALLTLHHASRKQRIAFGPFILLGALVALTV